ncbi:bZIP transcription factor TRAB1-like isoform X1 [Lolium rigidum]|uniref:bZIP transcription factor TRAB1-like isoform X1 n=1 Tax=Lolium rigidum TaxID=89674 RepID=UPI001F5D8117|nr:bZIP transcription factor TRAB1-like isoform X1 [Lolium rigidum]
MLGGEGIMDFRSNNNGGSSSDRRPAADGSTPLTRQGSVYSLTFEEFQSTLGGGAGAGAGGSGLGKDFSSMNMDELLRSIWTAEESQAMASATASGAGPGQDAGASSLQRQGSLTLPRTLSAKTVDEVWRNLVRDDPLTGVVADGAEPQPHRQATLGEMTLEEFLVKAGVVREIPTAPAPLPPPPMQQPRPVPVAPKAVNSFYGNFPGANDAGAVPLGFPPVAMGDLGLGNGLMPRAVGMGGGGALPVQTAVNPADSGSKGSEDLSSPSEPMPYSFEGIVRGRRTGGGVEKVVERRQRRMIKNRESAARSRARKQAYTMELEAEVQKLKDLNEELVRKQAEIMEMQKNEQAPEMAKDAFGRKKRQCLRRTLTGPW